MPDGYPVPAQDGAQAGIAGQMSTAEVEQRIEWSKGRGSVITEDTQDR